MLERHRRFLRHTSSQVSHCRLWKTAYSRWRQRQFNKICKLLNQWSGSYSHPMKVVLLSMAPAYLGTLATTNGAGICEYGCPTPEGTTPTPNSLGSSSPRSRFIIVDRANAVERRVSMSTTSQLLFLPPSTSNFVRSQVLCSRLAIASLLR